MSVMGMTTKRKKERMKRESAFEIVEKWVDETRSRVYGEELEELQDILWIAVVDDNLVMDVNEKRKFIYKLEEPIEKKDGSESISMVHISKRQLSEVFEMEKYKTDSAKTEQLIKTYCKDSDGKDISIGFISRMDPRDTKTIIAVVNAFFL